MRALKSFLTAAWLGWQIESNWTDPFQFFVFAASRPIASVLILVFMYQVIAGDNANPATYAYIYLGNTFYIYVGALMAGASYAVLDDRERYRVLKYLYIAPLNLPLYLLGRAVARFIVGSIAVMVTLAAGVWFLGVPLSLSTFNAPLFGLAMLLGVFNLTLMGVLLGSWSLTLRIEPWFAGEAVGAALYLFTGAIFPLSVLPVWLQPLGYVLPVTYWLELVRRALLGEQAASFTTLAGFSDAQLVLILLGMTAVLAVLTVALYRYFDHSAREQGLIDAQSNF